jgi:hypothetical protein
MPATVFFCCLLAAAPGESSGWLNAKDSRDSQ